MLGAVHHPARSRTGWIRAPSSINRCWRTRQLMSSPLFSGVISELECAHRMWRWPGIQRGAARQSAAKRPERSSVVYAREFAGFSSAPTGQGNALPDGAASVALRLDLPYYEVVVRGEWHRSAPDPVSDSDITGAAPPSEVARWKCLDRGMHRNAHRRKSPADGARSRAIGPMPVTGSPHDDA